MVKGGGRRFHNRLCFIVVAGAVATLLLSAIGASAQVDPNIQSRIETYNSTFTVQPLPVTTSSEAAGPAAAPSAVCYYDEKKKRCLTQSELNKRPTAEKKRAPNLLALPIVINPKIGAKGPSQPTVLKLQFPLIPGFETNATRARSNPKSAGTFSFGGGFNFITQGFRALDLIALSAGTSSIRYNALSGRDSDTVTASALYQAFIGAYDESGKPIDAWKGTSIQNGLLTFDTLTFGVTNSASFNTTFRGETVDLLTPSIVWSRQNIPLGQGHCLTPDKKTEAFCRYADLTASVGRTLSDLPSLQNYNAGVSATVGYRMPDSNNTISFVTSIGNKYYENAPTQRNDVLLQLGPKFDTAINKYVSASLSATYNVNFSTLGDARWQGLVMLARLTVATNLWKQ